MSNAIHCKFNLKYSIARKLAFYTLLFSSLITLLSTSMQLYFAYSRNVLLIEDRMKQIEQSYLESIVRSLWDTDSDLLKIQLEGILRLPDMQYLEVKQDDGPMIRVGIPGGERMIRRQFPLVYRQSGVNNHLGTLSVVAGLEGVYLRLVDQAIVILTTQAVEIFILSVFILFLFYVLVGKHLHAIAVYTGSLDMNQPDTPLVLRRGARKDTGEDELARVVFSINAMRSNLKTLYRSLEDNVDELKVSIAERKWAEEELRKHHDHLEELVRNRTEELRVAKERAEVANQAKSTFLSSMSHELRTPLNAVLGYTQILKRQHNLTEGQKHYLDIMQGSGEHLLTLINDILDLSKIEAQRMEIEEAPFNLPSVLWQLFNLTRVKAEQKDLSVQYEALTPLPKQVRGDERKLKQILLNLLGNAVKYTQRGGVSLRVSYEASGVFCCEVADTGMGIAMEKLEVIFEPFRQLAAGEPTREGSGLGLTITKRLMALMQGTLEVESEPGKGSTFRIEVALPPAEETDPTPMKKAEHLVVGYHGERKRILIVDDNITNISLLVSLLEPLGFEIDTAENGREALRRALELRPDLVLMDLVMPVLDGVETVKEMRQHRELDETRILGISATVSESERRRAFMAACNGFMPRPIQLELLLETVQTELEIVWQRAPQAFPAAYAVAAGEDEEAGETPPADVLEAVHRVVERGDFGALESLLVERLAGNEAYAPFCQRIRRYATRYDEEGIMAYLGRLGKEKRSENVNS